METHGSLANQDFAAAFIKDDTIRAVVTIGRDLDSLRAEAALAAKDRVRLERLFSRDA